MFTPRKLFELAKAHQRVLQDLGEIEKTLRNRFAEMDKEVSALILSVTTGEPLLFIGPPGTGKSRLIRAFCILTGLLKEDASGQATRERGDHNSEDGAYFEYLLTPFTEPGELFGFWDIKKATETGLWIRNSVGMMQHARIVYLDEVFNGSSAILNSILTIMNERLFHDRGRIEKVPIECFFGATNQIADTPELRALFDRFVIRCRVRNADAEAAKLHGMITKGWNDTYGEQLQPRFTGNATGAFFEDLRKFRQAIRESKLQVQPLNESPGVFNKLVQLVHSARIHNVSEMSNRRLVKLSHAMLVHRVYEGVKAGPDIAHFQGEGIDGTQLALLPEFFLDNDTEEQIVGKMRRTALEKS